jgi:hypothetical protein
VAEAEVHVVAVAPGGEGDGLRVIAADSASTDASGLAVFAAPDVPAGDRPLVSAYAVLPGRLAGFADEEPAPVSAPLAVSMTESRPVAGVVDLPAGFDPRRVTIRIRSLEIPGNPTRPGAPWSRRLTPGKPGVEEAWRPLFARQADASGRFAFADIPAAAHVELNAAAERLGRVETTVPAPRPADAVRLEMFLEGIIAGTLLHEESGAPAAGVGLLAEGAGHAAFEASTDAAGRFTFRGLADDFYIIRLPWDVDLGDWTLAARPLVRAAPGVVTGGIDLRLERGALVTGTVADAATAKPLRARVSAAGKQGTATFFTAAHAPTDDEGRYALRLPRGEFVLNAAPELPGYPHACRTSRSVAIAAGDTRKEGVDFLLEAEVVEAAAALPVQMGFGHARGRIVDPEGNPRPEVHVSSSPAFEPARGHVEEHESRETRLGLLRDHAKVAISDAEGRYEVAVPAGAPFLITAGGGRFGLARARAFLVAPGETHEVEDLVVGSGTSSIAGVVLDPAGNPLAGATIITRSRSKVTHGMQADLPRSNREGRFRVDHLMDGEILEVNVNKHGYFSRVWYGVLPDADGLRFVLHPDMDPAAPPEPSPDLDPGTLIGRAAPAWEVAEWLREPPPPARPDRGDGRETLLVLVPLRAKWEDLGPDLKAIEDLSRRTGAIPVAILASCEHASAARRAMAEHGLGLAIGIDAYRPARGHDTSVTRLRYGHRLRARVFRIDAAGIVRAHARKIEEAESLFRS